MFDVFITVLLYSLTFQRMIYYGSFFEKQRLYLALQGINRKDEDNGGNEATIHNWNTTASFVLISFGAIVHITIISHEIGRIDGKVEWCTDKSIGSIVGQYCLNIHISE